MESNYKNIKKLLSEEETNMPEALNWEQMEGGILDKMEVLENSKKRNSKRRFMYLVLAFLLLLIPLICTQSPDKNNDEFAADTLIKNESDSRSKKGNTIHNNPGNKTHETEIESNLGSQIVDESSYAIKNTTPAIKRTTENSVWGEAQNHKVKVASPSVKQFRTEAIDNEAGINSNVIDPDKSTFTPLTPPNQERFQMNENLAQGRNSKNLITAAALENRITPLLQNTRSNQITLLPLIDVENAEESLSHPKRLMLGTGLSLWDMGFGVNNPERDIFEKTQLSFNANVDFAYPLKYQFFFLVGLQYQQLESRFDRVNIVDDYTVLLEGVTTEIQTNSLTGGMTEIIGDVEVTVEAIHTVRNYNRISLMQLPVAFGRTFKSGKWQSDMMYGATLTLLSSSQGKTILDGNIIEYAGRSNAIMHTSWNINAMIMGRVSYALTPRLGIGLGLQYQRALNNWSAENGVSMRPHIVNIQVGLVTSF